MPCGPSPQVTAGSDNSYRQTQESGCTSVGMHRSRRRRMQRCCCGIPQSRRPPEWGRGRTRPSFRTLRESFPSRSDGSYSARRSCSWCLGTMTGPLPGMTRVNVLKHVPRTGKCGRAQLHHRGRTGWMLMRLARPARTGFYEAAARVNGIKGCVARRSSSTFWAGVTRGRLGAREVPSAFYSRSWVARRWLAGAGGDSKGGGAIYPAALGRRPSRTARSPTHRTCESPSIDHALPEDQAGVTASIV